MSGLFRTVLNSADLTASQTAQNAALAATGGAALIGCLPAGNVASRLSQELTSVGYANLQAAVTAAAGKTLRIIGANVITVALVVQNDTVIVLDPGAVVETATADISHFDCTGKSNVRIIGPGKIKKTGVGAAAFVAGVKLDGSINCLVYGVEFEGMQWAGVYLNNAVNCHALHNYVHDHLGTVQDASAFVVYRSCNGCAIENNKTKDTGYIGVLVQDPGAGTTPLRTKVLNNDIDGATAYGVCVYEIGPNDTDTLIDGNSIRNITGANPAGAGGAGIYIQSSGGVIATNNHVRNVCTATANNTLTPGGIGVNNITAALTPPLIDGNTIIDVGMTAAGASNPNAVTLAAVNVSSSPNGALVNSNTIRQGAGLTPGVFVGIFLNAVSNAIAATNKLDIASSLASSEGIFVFANGINVSNITLIGNSIKGCARDSIGFDQTGGFTPSNVSVSGGVLSGGGVGCVPLRMGSVVNGSIDGVVAAADIVAALSLASCSQIRVSGGSLTSTGATAIATTGVCTGGHLSKSTYSGAAASKLSNAGTGFSIEWQTNAIPSAGTWAVGDRAEQSVSIVGNPKGWRCTVAGSPGTWVSEGNL